MGNGPVESSRVPLVYAVGQLKVEEYHCYSQGPSRRKQNTIGIGSEPVEVRRVP